MVDLSDEELYQTFLQNRSHKAFKVLYERHSKPLYRFIYRFTLSSQATEDLLQDIFTQLLSGKFTLNPDANLKSWLYTIAKNRSLNHLKRVSFETVNEAQIEATQSRENIEVDLIEKNMASRLALAESRLPSEIQITWSLRKGGLDYQQIADRLSIPVGTVKSRYSRLVEILKKEFAK